MSMIEEQTLVERWWATGDMPMRVAPRAAFLIDGRMTMLEMCCHFLSARQSIHVAAWGITPDLLLVRGKHHHAGPDGSAEQAELLRWLGTKGLAERDLLFWQQCEALSVANVLSYAASKGVDVRILLWDSYGLPFQATGAQQVQELFEPLGIYCLPDDSQKGLLNHPLTSMHQKAVVVDNRYAFVGGIDMMIENDGDYDRWDTKGHLFHNPLRASKDGVMPHGWHDVHILFEGPAVADVEQNFRQRWNAVVEAHELDPALHLEDPPTSILVSEPVIEKPEHTVGELRLQVIRTIPNRMYKFAPEEGIATILQAYQQAFSQARQFIYIENQYFWRQIFLGVENPVLGKPHPDMEKLMQTLAEALARGVIVTLLLPDNPNVGREFTDDGLNYLWEIAPRAVAAGTLQAYTLGCSMQQDDAVRYRSIYVHGKVTIVDDEWITVGSANLNNRGMRDDAELNISILHPKMAQGLRILLMAEHLGLCDEDTLFRIIEVMGRVRLTDELEHMEGDIATIWERLQQQLSDPLAGTAMFAKQARKNLLAVKQRRPLVGHLSPYIPHSRAQDYEVEIHAANGWLDMLPAN
ncbi:MAG TPA: phospholipase D family protein [Ktedonobacteraceae bacterium]|nr:phospholipase D family protein [Ktedonobacteraceae bacterium]